MSPLVRVRWPWRTPVNDFVTFATLPHTLPSKDLTEMEIKLLPQLRSSTIFVISATTPSLSLRRTASCDSSTRTKMAGCLSKSKCRLFFYRSLAQQSKVQQFSSLHRTAQNCEFFFSASTFRNLPFWRFDLNLIFISLV